MTSATHAALDLMRYESPLPRTTASSRIYDDLRQRILSLELPPGTNLLRAELAREYDVSQTPLRDALQRLEQDGLIKTYPQSRTLVTRIDMPMINEALFLRRALETEVVVGLSQNAPPETIARARTVIEMQVEVAKDRSQLRRFQELDEYFHFLLFEGLRRENLHSLLRSRSGDLDRVRRLQVHSDEKLRVILKGHADVIDAIEAGKVQRAIEEIRHHTYKPADWADEYRDKFPDYFA
ncbi:GntR family transcriptional regulator [Pseudooceanicola sp. C21-150M6]|uniref:GntR family transcriptional regulator n=1 Tax=Pseudooceanicola sp. C21-150M6 TaxID=3434355 RepID=UPI003D7F8728